MSAAQTDPGCSKFSDSFTDFDNHLAKQVLLCLKPLDDLLKCRICFEYFNTCVNTKCCHSFCSLCIRKYMTYKTQCPQCFQEATEPELRCNRQLDEVVLIYSQIRTLLQPFHENSINTDLNSSLCDLQTPSTSRRSASLGKIQSPPQKRASDTSPVNDVISQNLVPSASQMSKNVIPPDQECNRVSCPVCSVSVMAEKINVHLDRCLALRENAEPSDNRNRRKPLAKVVYHLLSDKEIKKRLKENGLSTSGNRQKLIKRHKNFLLLYNSECDKMNPRPVSEILQQVENEENEMKNTDTTKLFQSDKKSNPIAIQQENENYLKQNKSQFDSLIEEICKRRSNKKGNVSLSESCVVQDTSTSTVSDPFDESSDWQERTWSPDLFDDVDTVQESSEVVVVEDSDDDEISVLTPSQASANSSEDFEPWERGRRSQRVLKRKIGGRSKDQDSFI